MKVQLEATTKVVQLTLDGQTVPARIWEGVTESGIPCHAYITRIACPESADCSEFERELQEQRKPSADVAALPLSLIL